MELRGNHIGGCNSTLDPWVYKKVQMVGPDFKDNWMGLMQICTATFINESPRVVSSNGFVNNSDHLPIHTIVFAS